MPPITAAERPVILWFRRDLRLADNPALAAAAARGPIIPVFLRPGGGAERAPGRASLWWLDKSLSALASDLERLGVRLILRSGAPAAALTTLAEETGARALVFNRLSGAAERADEREVAAAMAAIGVEVASEQSELLLEPGAVLTGSGRAYQVFTPFWRAFRPLVPAGVGGRPAPKALRAAAAAPASQSLADWGLRPRTPDWSEGFNVFKPGEADAQADLETFVRGPLRAYAEERNRPDKPGTSRLSPRLHWGEISPAQVWSRAALAETAEAANAKDVFSFQSELAWREFNHHMLAAEPDLDQRNFKSAFDAFPWRDDASARRAWRRGETGYPLVDAGMRELWTTGFMHNRVRMVVGSFLVKHLLEHWRWGERWFWDTLLDADHANNVMNWQWIAGCGADAAPYFRIFNPTAQAERFDPDGAYVRRWAPELARLPTAFVHAPWRAPPLVRAAAGVKLGSTYPEPIVDHDEGRRRALAAYEKIRSSGEG